MLQQNPYKYFFFFSFFLQEDFIHIGVVFHFKRWTFYLSSDTFYSNENIDQIILWKICDDCQQS